MSIDTSHPAGHDHRWYLGGPPLDACPGCGAVELHPVYDGEQMNYLCPLCLSCWHVELGSVHEVRPETCPGCQYELICAEHRRSRGG